MPKRTADDNDDDPGPQFARHETASVLDCVVKVYCTSVRPNYAMPWQMKRQQESTSSGFLLAESRLVPGRKAVILTNAHSVSHAVKVLVRKHGSPVKFVASVLFVGHECDTAVLTVEDPQFWQGLPPPLELGHSATLQDPVTVVGYPTGGDNLSVTVGVISRVDVGAYSHSSERFLTLQIDAAINAGNSGGPALKGGRVVGIAFETLDDAENIGYIIPTQIIDRFLNDLATHGRYTHWCSVGFVSQAIESPALKAHLKMGPDQTGVLIGQACATSPHPPPICPDLTPISIRSAQCLLTPCPHRAGLCHLARGGRRAERRRAFGVRWAHHR